MTPPLSTLALSSRLNSIHSLLKYTQQLIHELQSFPNQTNIQPDSDVEEARLVLANTAHDSLKELEEALELLRSEVDDHDSSVDGGQRRRTSGKVDGGTQQTYTALARVEDDVRNTRASFRRAQLQSKRNIDAQRQREREQLFASRRSGATNGNDSVVQPGRAKSQKELTQDELAVNAANDVTRALRRTHALMVGNLQQSSFAQQTLEESQQQLTSLSERYKSTTDLLQSSRSLVKTLITSQKSDTWYLQTSVLILLVTLGWLIFRRLLYGPLWWLAWLPTKYFFKLLYTVFGIGGSILASSVSSSNSSAISSVSGFATVGATTSTRNAAQEVRYMYHSLPPKGAGWEVQEPNRNSPSPEEIERIKEMVRLAEQGTNTEVNQQGGSDTKLRPREAWEPVNSKKRMMDGADDEFQEPAAAMTSVGPAEIIRDEL